MVDAGIDVLYSCYELCCGLGAREGNGGLTIFGLCIRFIWYVDSQLEHLNRDLHAGIGSGIGVLKVCVYFFRI